MYSEEQKEQILAAYTKRPGMRCLVRIFGVSRCTRQIVASAIGNRAEQTCRKLWERMPGSYRDCQIQSEFRNAHQKVFPEEKIEWMENEIATPEKRRLLRYYPDCHSDAERGILIVGE